MFDPAVMGTLLIGLEAVRAEANGERPRRSVAGRRRRLIGLRLTLAHGLRRAAALLEQPAAGEVVS
jgi:hypothetical protein